MVNKLFILVYFAWSSLLASEELSLASESGADTDEIWCGSGKLRDADIFLAKTRRSSDSGSVDIRIAQIKAVEEWSGEMQLYVKKLVAAADRESAVKIKRSQKAWDSYIQAETKWRFSKYMVFNLNGGSSGPILVDDWYLGELRRRTCYLKESYEAGLDN